MTARLRPRAPLHAPFTRRLSLIRVGLPTLVACIIAIPGPSVALSAPTHAMQGVASAVVQTTSALDGGPSGHDHHGAGDGPRGVR